MEQAVTESYKEHEMIYNRDRVFYNYSGHRPAEPSSVAVAATWHTLTRMLMHVIDVARKECAGRRLIHPWEQDAAARKIQYYLVKYGQKIASKHKKERLNKVVMEKYLIYSNASSRQSSLRRKSVMPGRTPSSRMNDRSLSTLDSDVVQEFETKETDSDRSDEETVVKPMQMTKSMSSRRQSSRFFLPSDSTSAVDKSTSVSGSQSLHRSHTANSQVLMNLSDGCIKDIRSLTLDSLIPNIAEIVGYDETGKKIEPMKSMSTTSGKVEDDVHTQLVKQGALWAEHVNEPWHMLVLVAVYIFLSVGLGVTLFCAIGDAVAAILKIAGVPIGDGQLMFSLRHPDVIMHQPIGWTLVGLALQIIDAAWFVWLGKNFTRFTRLIHGRPLAARHGKRTIVIVDNPTVHQLTEIFVSKLFSQSYSIVSVDVHGASGLDHFVHRFTHRVARGLLIALGRPDGRLACLSKSESSILLSAKQAAFIRNPDYNFEGSGPEFVTIGHNPFEPNLGLAKHIVLPSTDDSTAVVKQPKHIVRRKKFVDEYLFDRLFFATKPFTLTILRVLRKAVESGSSKISGKVQNLTASSQEKLRRRSITKETRDELLPYGVHHIDPMVLINSDNIGDSVFADFVSASIDVLKQRAGKGSKTGGLKEKSSDPAVRLAFSSKLDTPTRQVQDLQIVVQQFYECRIASLERYMSFCVMFHSMAEKCCKPWFLYPWDIARSQSNLRVATTASPISAGDSSEETSQEVKKLARQMAFALRKFYTNF